MLMQRSVQHPVVTVETSKSKLAWAWSLSYY